MTVVPRLLNPTTIQVKQTVSADTRYDHRRRAPANTVARTTVMTISAQIKWSMSSASSQPVASQAGVDEQEAGYAVVLKSEFDALASPIKRGDHIVKIEDLDVSLYVLRLEYASHYGGKFTLVKVIFEDRTGQDG